MFSLKLSRPVYTLDKQLLCGGGTVLSAEKLDELVYSNRQTTYPSYTLSRYGALKRDVLRLIRRPPYDLIFSDEHNVDEIIKLMDSVKLSLPVLQTLDYFKQEDYHTYCHCLMVFALSTVLARDLLDDYHDMIREVSTSPTHDIGKTCVPLDILRKQTPLTASERYVIEHHAASGYVLLSYYLRDYRSLTSVVARDHHERRDGSGHPRGILLDDRMVDIIVVCDVYDALVSPRPYRPDSYDNRTALEEITEMADTNQVSWYVVKALIAHNRKKHPHFTEAYVSQEKRGIPPSKNLYGIEAEDENRILFDS